MPLVVLKGTPSNMAAPATPSRHPAPLQPKTTKWPTTELDKTKPDRGRVRRILPPEAIFGPLGKTSLHFRKQNFTYQMLEFEI